MIFVLYGSDTIRSRAKLKDIIEEYRQKAGEDLAVYRFDAEEDDSSAINAALEGESLFQTRKLVLIQHALRSDQFKGLKFKGLKNTAVVFWERELDAAAKKYLGELKQFGAKIQEFRTTAPITDDKAIFKLGDVFFTSPKEARRHLLALLTSGHDERHIFSYLANQARTLLLVKSYMEAHEPIPTHHKIHPFVIKKASAAVRGFPMDKLRQTLQDFFEEDLRIKTGLSTPKDSLLRLIG